MKKIVLPLLFSFILSCGVISKSADVDWEKVIKFRLLAEEKYYPLLTDEEK